MARSPAWPAGLAAGRRLPSPSLLAADGFRQPLEQGARPHRLDEIGVEPGGARRAEIAPLERRQEDEGAADAGETRLLGDGPHGVVAERVIGDHVVPRRHRDLGERVAWGRDEGDGGACRLQAPGQEGRLERRMRDDQDALAGEVGLVRRLRAGRVRRRQRQGDPEGGAVPDPAVERDLAAHAFDDAARDGEPEPGAAVAAARAAVALLELVVDRRDALRRDAGAGVAHLDDDAVRLGRHDDADAADLGELDGVAGEVDQHLSEAVAVADDPARHAGGHEGGDLDALALRFRGQELDDALDEGVQIERRGDDVDAPGLDLGEVEDLVDERQEGLAGGLDGVRVGGLLGLSGVSRMRSVMPRMPFSGVRNSWLTVARKRDFASLAASALLRASSKARSDTTRSVTSRPRRRIGGGAAGTARRRLDPGDPADAVPRRDRLVDEARAVGAGVDRPALDHPQCAARADRDPGAGAPGAGHRPRWRRGCARSGRAGR